MASKELFLKGMPFCATHSSCAYCPIHKECNGVYDMLQMALAYIIEITKEKDNGSEKED